MYKVNLMRRVFQNDCRQCRKYGWQNGSQQWTSNRIRQTFVGYFRDRNHLFVPSSSVVAKKNDGSYFVNSGMNQFKPVFLGNVDQSSEMAGYKRVVNYQKCIRVGGKHNDLDDVGHDHYHHTFFEMLGNWSFNDYSKAEACKMAWDLLTNVYKIPKSRLYITYFGGVEEMGLKVDEECRDVWMKLGIPKDRIIPFGLKDNFWVMGETGPCGPCSEIHYYHGHETNDGGGAGGPNFANLVNKGVEEMKEIWNLVFMQYDRQADGTLVNLPATHIDTGMGLERLTALLQSKSSNYDTDLFRDIFNHIATITKIDKYSGCLASKTDTAYRIIADHMRMCTICITDGLMPGRKDSEGKLRQVLYRCLYQAHEVLKMPNHSIHSLVPTVIQSLEEAYPYLEQNVHQIEEVINETESRYLSSISAGRKMMKKALAHFKCSTAEHILSGEEILKIQEGYFGNAVSYDIISLLAHEFHVSLDSEDYDRCVHNMNDEKSQQTASHHHHHQQQLPSAACLNQHDIIRLKELNVQPTDDSYKYIYTVDDQNNYDYPTLTSKIVAIKVNEKFEDSVMAGSKNCSVILDKTCLYATAGGQVNDVGSLVLGNHENKINNVTNHSGYILHCIDEVNGLLKVGDEVVLHVCKDRRTNSSSNHTATHILNFSLHRVLGGWIRQKGSVVKDNVLTFDFSSLRANITLEDLEEVSKTANEIVNKNVKVHRQVVPLEGVQNLPFVLKLDDEPYPKLVTVVSVGSALDTIQQLSSSSMYEVRPCSVELCAGTHIDKTGDIGSIVITNFEGSIQGTKRITAVTRQTAKKAKQNADEIKNKLSIISSTEDINEKLVILKDLDRAISSGLLLPKIERETILEEIKNLSFELSQHKNKLSTFHIKQNLLNKVNKNKNKCVVCTFPMTRTREIVECLVDMKHNRPIMIFSNIPKPNYVAIAYVPLNFSQFDCESWASYMCREFRGQYSLPKGKLSRHTNVMLLSIPVKDGMDLNCDVLIEKSEEFVSKNCEQKKEHLK